MFAFVYFLARESQERYETYETTCSANKKSPAEIRPLPQSCFINNGARTFNMHRLSWLQRDALGAISARRPRRLPLLSLLVGLILRRSKHTTKARFRHFKSFK